MKNRVIFLDGSIFNNKYTITLMNKQSLILKDKQSGEQVFVHKRVLNAISTAKEPIPCCLLDKEFHGRTDKWLATFFSL